MPRCENPACGKDVPSVRRLVIGGGYEAALKKPVFLCPECSARKLRELRDRGFDVDEGLFDRTAGAGGTR